MNFDLRQGLHDLSRAPGVREESLAVDALVATARRRRTTRSAAVGVVGAGAATALAIGGAAGLHDLRRPAIGPVLVPTLGATTTPTSTPAPTAGPSAAASPSSTPTGPLGSSTWAPSWELCGGAVPDDGGALPEPLSFDDPTAVLVGPGDPIPFTHHLSTSGATEDVTARILDVVALPLHLGPGGFPTGPVVGVSAPVAAPVAEGPVAPGTDGLLISGTVAMSACGDTAVPGDGSPLGLGTYLLLTEVELTRADGTRVVRWTQSEANVDDPTTDAVPGLKTGDTAALSYNRADTMASVSFPRCGQAYFPDTPGSSWFTVSGSARLAGADVVASVTSTNTGGLIAGGQATDAFLTVTRNGIVVAQSSEEATIPFLLVDWASGATVTREEHVDAVACSALGPDTPAGAPLPAGEYQVWAWQEVGQDYGSVLNWSFYGGPWSVTIP